jgi:LuxR family transcriptional regulator, maltose regulon positive regulatory protein
VRPPVTGATSRPGVHSVSLLEAKFAPPRAREGIIGRTSVLDRLRGARRAPVVVITAPAGYGKTTLAAAWAAESGRRAGWYSVGPHDDNAAMCLLYIAGALGRAGIDVGPVFELAGKKGSRPARVVAALGSAVASAGDDVVLVLDDVDRLRSRACLSIVAAVIAQLPPGSQVVLTARSGPTLPLARLRNERKVIDLGEDDLRMNDDEAAALLHAAGVAIGDDDVAELNAQCEGWPTGLYLAALAMRGGREPGRAPFSGADRDVSDFFRLEVVDGLPPAERDLLLRASVLDRVCGELADHALEAVGMAEALAGLAASNLFVHRVEGEVGWFRFHHLFQEMLRAELERREPAAVERVLTRAADWYEERGEIETAVECALGAGDRERVAALFPLAGPGLVRSGRMSTAERWFEALDDPQLLARNPAVAVVGVIHYSLTGREETTQRWAEAAVAGDGRGKMFDGSKVSTWLAFVHALAFSATVDEMREAAETCRDGLPPDSPLLPAAQHMVGLAYLAGGDTSAADEEFARGYELARTSDGHVGAVLTLALRSLLASARGDRHAAVELAHSSRELLGDAYLHDHAFAAIAHIASARVALDGGARVAATDEIALAHLLLPKLASIHALSSFARLELAHLHLALGSAARARELLDEIEELGLRGADVGAIREAAATLRHDIDRGRSAADQWQSTLTPAELRLLPLLSTHLSFREIAVELGISRNTVKTQAIAVYRKLDVSSRSDAVDRATELGLL